MSQPNKKRSAGKLSPFAQARAQANLLLDIAFSQKSPNFETVRIGRHTMRLAQATAVLNAARARVETHFAQQTMETDAIRQRISSGTQQDVELPFSVMTGEHR